jgi:hypothetical protein
MLNKLNFALAPFSFQNRTLRTRRINKNILHPNAPRKLLIERAVVVIIPFRHLPNQFFVPNIKRSELSFPP